VRQSTPLTRMWADLRRLFLGNRRWESGLEGGAAAEAIMVITGWIGGEWTDAGEDCATTLRDGEALELRVRDLGGARATVTVSGPHRRAESVQVGEHVHEASAERWPEGHQVGALQIGGDEELIASWLSAGTRASLPDALALNGLAVVDGAVEFAANIGDGTLAYTGDDEARPVDWTHIASTAREAMAVATDLARAASHLDVRLEERTWDHDEHVRLHAARLILHRLAGASAPRRLIHLLLQSGDVALMRLANEHHPDGLVTLGSLAATRTLPDAGRVAVEVQAGAAILLLELPGASAAPIAAALKAVGGRHGADVALAVLRSRRSDLHQRAVEQVLAGAASRDGTAQLSLLDDLLPAFRAVATEEQTSELLHLWFARAEHRRLVAVGEELNRRGARSVLATRADDLVRIVGHPELPIWHRALTLASRIKPPDAVGDGVLAELLSSGEFGIKRGALQLLGVYRRPALAAKVGLFENHLSSDEALALCGELGALGGVEARAQLRRVLDLAEGELAVYACLGLGRCGLVDDIEALLEAEQRPDKEVNVAAREAIDEIQARVGPTGRGALSVVERDAGGKLSLAASGLGDLALTDEERES